MDNKREDRGKEEREDDKCEREDEKQADSLYLFLIRFLLSFVQEGLLMTSY